jgi:hypothetical protein
VRRSYSYHRGMGRRVTRYAEPLQATAAEPEDAEQELLVRELVTGLQEIVRVTPRLKDKRSAAKILAAIWEKRPDLRPNGPPR